MSTIYKVVFYDMTRHRSERWRLAKFATREVAVAFFLDANLACLFEGRRKIAESVRCEQ